MKRMACIAIIVSLIIGFQFSSASADSSFGEALPLFEKAGSPVSDAASAGGLIFGAVTGILGCLPASCAGLFIGGIFYQAPLDGMIIGSMVPFAAGVLIGQVALGTPALISKILFYDVPIALFNPETYQSKD